MECSGDRWPAQQSLFGVLPFLVGGGAGRRSSSYSAAADSPTSTFSATDKVHVHPSVFYFFLAPHLESAELHYDRRNSISYLLHNGKPTSFEVEEARSSAGTLRGTGSSS